MPTPTPPPPEVGAPDPLEGLYSLTATLGAGCENLPAQARERTYSAVITRGAPDGLVVTLSGSTFLQGGICFAASGLGCHQFYASRDGDRIGFDLRNENDDGHGGHIVEQIPPGTWLELIGKASGRLENGAIRATGGATAWYCPSVMGYPFPCFNPMSCQTSELKLTLVAK